VGARSRGFTLVEFVVAVGIAVVLGYFLVRATGTFLHWSAIQAQRDGEHAAIESLVDRWRAEEDSAWAIFTPATDVNGVSNGDGHEIDFFTRDAKYRSYFWAYGYDSAKQTLTRYLYGAPGGAATIDETYSGVTSFYARTYPLTALQDPSSKVYSPLYNGATLQPGAVRFYGASRPDIAGGNQITYVRVEGPSMVREMQLATRSAPSGFTVVLQYTPAPTATPKVALNAWPQYVELPMGGQSLQTSWAPAPRDVAYYVNRLLGGGVANAALTSCGVNQGRAFTDGAFSTPLANARAPVGALPSGVTGSTDASGCISFSNGANVALYEPGYTGTFVQTSNICGLAVAISSDIPASAQGPMVQLVSRGGTELTRGCTMTWQDQGSTPSTTTTTYEVSGCNGTLLVGLGATCYINYLGDQWGTPPDCTPGGSGGIQYTYMGSFVTSGPGVIVTAGGQNQSVQRTGSGTITVAEKVNELMCNGLQGTKIINATTNVSFTD